eukprot:4928905-Alexandrium_andersonii.AAC.1
MVNAGTGQLVFRGAQALGPVLAASLRNSHNTDGRDEIAGRVPERSNVKQTLFCVCIPEGSNEDGDGSDDGMPQFKLGLE